MASSVTIPRGMRSTPMTQDELQAYARTLRDKGVGKESVQGPAAQQEAMPEMTMEMAMLSPISPERAFNHPMYSPLNAPTATTRNAPRPSTINSPRPSTLNGPRLPEPSMMEMDTPPPAMQMPLPPGALAPNGMEDWGGAVYGADGGMRPIPELQQLPPYVQSAIGRSNPSLQSFFGESQAPMMPRGTPEDMATMARFRGGLDAIPARLEYAPSAPLRTELDGKPFDPDAFGPQPDINPNRDMTFDMGDGPVRMMGTHDPIVSPERRRAQLEQDLSDAILASETSGPASRDTYIQKAGMLQGALQSLDGGVGGGLSFDQRLALKDKDAERSAATRKSIEDLERERIASRNKSEEFKRSQAQIMSDIANNRLTLANYALRLRGIDDGIASDRKLMEETMDPAMAARLEQRILMKRNERDALLEALPMIPTESPKREAGATTTTTAAPSNVITVEQLDDLIEQFRSQFPDASEEELRRLANQHLDDNGLELADDEE